MTALARHRPYLRTGAVVATTAVAYYLLAVRRRPVLRYGKTQLNERVVQRLAHILHAPYSPTVWAFHPWVQLLVVLSRMRATKSTPFTRTTLTAPDGGTIALDVLEDTALPPTAPVLLILPTITGLSRDHVHLAKSAHSKGWRAVVCVRRGHLGTPLTTPRVNLLGCTDDLRLQVEAVTARFPGAPLLGVGLSAGTGLLVRYLGEEAEKSRITAAAVLCPGYNTAPPELSAPGKGNAFERFAGPANKQITKSVKRFFLRHDILRSLPSYDALQAAPSIAAYQAAAYALEGYKDAEEMYARTNPMAVADAIRTPLLIVNAKDDPVCVWANVEENLHLLDGPHDRILVATSHGSHCAHLEGAFWPSKLGWHERLALNYFDAVLAHKQDALGEH
jgi:predicted alpha/beta-fold hydrolase